MKLKINSLLFFSFLSFVINAQNYNFDYNNHGKRVCHVYTTVNTTIPSARIHFLDSANNNLDTFSVYRRLPKTTSWNLVASNLLPGTGHWDDTDVSVGDVWEYQIKRQSSWTFGGNDFKAIGYSFASLKAENANYRGQMILLIAGNIVDSLPLEYERLKMEIRDDGWLINELIAEAATSWDSGSEVVGIRDQIQTIYTNSELLDKPKLLFILGHVPLPRSGSADIITPDDHSENRGARGADVYYADIDGVFTDTATFNPGGLISPELVNLPNDFKWDQDFFPSDVELAFGRIDFYDIFELPESEIQLTKKYLDRLSAYKNVNFGHDMGSKTAYYLGFDNSNDGTFRGFPNVSKPENVFENTSMFAHSQYVSENGPFAFYMQNILVPEISDWQTYGMNATIFSSDQSYWGFGDLPNYGNTSRIRSLLGVNSKCLMTIWTTTGLNMFQSLCIGDPVGLAFKDIMNHNQSNNLLEKPEQEYDDYRWWNRTHFALFGDPSIQIYQVSPITNLQLNQVNTDAVLSWNASIDADVIAYSILESSSEFGKYTEIGNTDAGTLNFLIPNYSNAKFYMVKAQVLQETGCGEFLQYSLGRVINANLSVSLIESPAFETSVYPNPFKENIQLKLSNTLDWQHLEIQLLAMDGKQLLTKSIKNDTSNCDLSTENIVAGTYMLNVQITLTNGDKLDKRMKVVK